MILTDSNAAIGELVVALIARIAMALARHMETATNGRTIFFKEGKAVEISQKCKSPKTAQRIIR